MEEELDMLFGTSTNAKNEFLQLKDATDPDNEQISTHSMNDKTILDTIKEKVEELISDDKEPLISNKNSENALPDELSEEPGIPISTVSTDGIHHYDNTENEELISSHNSERALDEKPLTTNTEEIHVISTHNSSKFVDQSLD